LKRKLLSLIGLLTLLVVNANADNRYWVGGTGSWNNPKNWSATSGGTAGAAIPTANDDVFFDQNSFQSALQVVQVNNDAYCKTIDFSAISQKVILGGGKNVKLNIAGNFIFSSNFTNLFKVHFIFTSYSLN